MNKFEEFEKILDMVSMEEDKRATVLKHSKVFFEYRDYMTEKHDMSDEGIEAMTNTYVHNELKKSPELMELIGEGDISVIGKIVQKQATEEGFEKPIEESMTVFLNFYNELS